MPISNVAKLGRVASVLLLSAAGLLSACASAGSSGGAAQTLAAAAKAEDYHVRILRDSWGVPHIFGKTDADAAFGFGYAHCEDDFETIQGTLLAARGNLAEAFGISGAGNDFMVSLVRVWDVVEAGYEKDLSPEVRAICEGYAAGFNLYASEHPEKVLAGSLPVSGRDIVAGFVHKTPLFYGLDRILGQLNSMTERPEVARKGELKTASAAADAPGIASAWLTGGDPDIELGSNTFSIAPSRSADGFTRIAINSHQPWTGPVAWYEVHIHSEEGWDMVGGTFPGAPIILHGHNRNLGWAHTVNSPDLIDVYELTLNPENPDQYMFDGEWLDLEVREAPIKISFWGPFSWTFKRKVYYSVHGPVMKNKVGAYAIRFAAMGDVRLIEQWFRMNKAENFDEWRDAMRMGALPMFNTGYADAEGNIGYFYNARFPVRSEDYDWSGYLPGDTSETLWTEYVPFDDLPMVVNPKSGFVFNANGTPYFTTAEGENPDPADFSATFGIELTKGNRELRLMEQLGSDESITAKEFYDYKYDRFYSVNSREAKTIARIAALPEPDGALLKNAQQVLAAWDRETNPDNTSTAMAVLTHRGIRSRAARGDSEWEEVSDDDLWSAVGEAAGALDKAWGRLDVPWHWVNRLRRGDTELGIGGGPGILHAVYTNSPDEDGKVYGRAGDCYILLAEWGPDGVSSQSIHQFGSATLRTDSPHYDDQAHLFVKRQMKPVWMDEADILAHLEEEYRPGERRKKP